jgi:hypothetical protein
MASTARPHESGPYQESYREFGFSGQTFDMLIYSVLSCDSSEVSMIFRYRQMARRLKLRQADMDLGCREAGTQHFLP